MLISSLLAVVTLVVTLTFHVSILLGLARWIYGRRAHPILQLNAAFMVLCVAHVAEILAFAAVTWFACDPLQLGQLEGRDSAVFKDYVYFAFETYTTVGYGNVTLVGDVQALAAAAALVGIVLTASSASLTFLAINQFAREVKKATA